jgi:hypothetical protein
MTVGYNSAGKSTSGMDKFGTVIDRMNMKLGSKFHNSLKIKTQLLKRLQRVIVVDGAIRSQKDGVESNGGSFKAGAEAVYNYAVPVRQSAGSAVKCPHST